MTDYVVSPNFGLSESINARMNILMGYPNLPTKTEQYSEPIEHFTDTGTFLLIIKEVWAPKLNRNATVADITGELNPGELNSIKSRETLETEGAFLPSDPLEFPQLLLELGEPLLLENGTELLLE